MSKAGRSHPARRSPASVIACLVLLASAPGPAWAIPIAFTDFAAFEAALPGAATVLDFDGLAAGTTIADGETIDGITFHYDFGGVAMLVSDVFDTTSPSNYLSTDDSDVFQDGDDFSLSFDPVNAIGLLFITADELFDGDITLSTGSISATLSAGDAGTPLPDGGVPYFLGIIDDTTPFTSVDITTIGGGFFLYNVDDIITARTAATPVPEPSTTYLLAIGLIALLAKATRARYTLTALRASNANSTARQSSNAESGQ